MTHDFQRLRHFAVAALAALALPASCSSVGTSRETARDQATTAVCGRISMCGKIGPGGAYPSDDNCQIMQKSFWEGAWKPADCDGKIDVNNLNVCLEAIAATDCGGGLDTWLTLGKCTAAKVCGAPADGGA